MEKCCDISRIPIHHIPLSPPLIDLWAGILKDPDGAIRGVNEGGGYITWKMWALE